MPDTKPVQYAATIYRPRQDVYDQWRQWQNLPRYARHLKSVEDLGNGRTRWTAEGPNGDVTWEAETTEEIPGRRIAWHSVKGSDIKSSGAVEFRDAPMDRGTEVYCWTDVDVPGGFFGKGVAKMTGNHPDQEIGDAMRRFKAILECGEVPINEGQPSNIKRGDNMPGDPSPKLGLR